ncbi:MAG: hypothetical protein ACPL1A_10260 [Candidatus Kapaibacteriota bacterium]
MKEIVERLFKEQLIPVFNEVLSNKYQGIKSNTDFEQIVKEVSIKLLQPLLDKREILFVDKLVDEYMES